ncbi:MAG: zinc ribbon domain-containing protein [Clostridia bacterium]|nr:zinc ribbon domain-containing protein [Clostridia bacterium]
MPTYDFICTKCKHKFTVMVAIKDREKVTCPQCGGEVRQSFLGYLAGFVSSSKDKASSCGSGG